MPERFEPRVWVQRSFRATGCRTYHQLSFKRCTPICAPIRPAPSDLSQVVAWNEVVLNQEMACSGCGEEIPRDRSGFVGLSDEPETERVWLCATSIQAL